MEGTGNGDSGEMSSQQVDHTKVQIWIIQAMSSNSVGDMFANQNHSAITSGERILLQDM